MVGNERMTAELEAIVEGGALIQYVEFRITSGSWKNDWLAGLLLRTFADFGVDAAAEPNSGFSRIVRAILGWFFFVFVPGVFAYLDFFGLKKWFFELLGRLK
jgi:hypothetical protein